MQPGERPDLEEASLHGFLWLSCFLHVYRGFLPRVSLKQFAWKSLFWVTPSSEYLLGECVRLKQHPSVKQCSPAAWCEMLLKWGYPSHNTLIKIPLNIHAAVSLIQQNRSLGATRWPRASQCWKESAKLRQRHKERSSRPPKQDPGSQGDLQGWQAKGKQKSWGQSSEQGQGETRTVWPGSRASVGQGHALIREPPDACPVQIIIIKTPGTAFGWISQCL